MLAMVVAYLCLAVLSLGLGAMLIAARPFGASGIGLAVLGCILVYVAYYTWRKGGKDA